MGLLSVINGKKVVNLTPSGAHLRIVPDVDKTEQLFSEATDDRGVADVAFHANPNDEQPVVVPVEPENRRVFVSHGSNKAIVAQLKEMLTYGKNVPVSPRSARRRRSACREGDGRHAVVRRRDHPRRCGERDPRRERRGARQLNSNVLIEIGAAMALYGPNVSCSSRRARSSSNLQGLYEVRYEGKSLDGNATMRLLRAFNDFKR